MRLTGLKLAGRRSINPSQGHCSARHVTKTRVLLGGQAGRGAFRAPDASVSVCLSVCLSD